MMQRKTLNLSEQAAEELSPFLEAASPERAALEALVGQTFSSESEVLRALVRLGMDAVLDHRLEIGYAAWAAEWSDSDERWSRAASASADRAWRDES